MDGAVDRILLVQEGRGCEIDDVEPGDVERILFGELKRDVFQLDVAVVDAVVVENFDLFPEEQGDLEQGSFRRGVFPVLQHPIERVAHADPLHGEDMLDRIFQLDLWGESERGAAAERFNFCSV